MSTQRIANSTINVAYTQSDVEAIRQQIEQEEASRRRLLLMALAVTMAAAVGAAVLASTTYSLYAGAREDRLQLASENEDLKARLERAEAQLAVKNEEEARALREREEARARMTALLPAVVNASAGSGDIGELARSIYNLPERRVEIDRLPPNRMFRNWRVRNDGKTEVYTLVGGNVDGKWVIYSNLIHR